MKKNGRKSMPYSKENKNNIFDSNILNNSHCYIIKNQNINDIQILKRLIEAYKHEIKNISDCLKFNEENYEEEISIIRKQMANYLNENIVLKTSNDKLILENNYKDKEIEKYRRIIQDYQKLLLNNNEKENYFKNTLEENKYSNNNEILLESKLEKLKADNLLILNDLNKEKSEHNSTKISLNHYKENILIYEKKISKKNLKIMNLKKEIKELKKSLSNISIKFNLLNINDSSITSGSFSTPSKINFNNDNNSNAFSNFSFNSKNTNNNTMNDNFLRHINKLLGENNFLRKEIQKAKNRLFDSNVQIQIYESQEEEILRLKQIIQNMNDYIQNIINQKILLINFINKQINELNQNYESINKDINMKFDLMNTFSNNYNNINSFSLNDISVFFKYIFNKIISLYYNIDINKNKEQYYIKEIKDNEIEKKILEDQIFEKECDIEAYKETLKSYENTIKKINEEKNNIMNILNSKKS